MTFVMSVNMNLNRKAKTDETGGLLTSKSTEARLFIVFTNVRLVIPPDCSPEVLRGSDWPFPITYKTLWIS